MTTTCDPRYPESFPRRILLITTGTNPQVVTETVYWLGTQRQPRFVPTKVHLVSTSSGVEQARKTLLPSAPRDRFGELCREYGFSCICTNPPILHTIAGQDGNPLEDIRTLADNEAAANTIFNLVRELTADSEAAVHASIAGGRKTLGFYLGYSMSLCGRTQDRISHVLVNPPFESHPEFYFPPRKDAVLTTPAGSSINTRDARVDLADIPFVRLRHGLSQADLRAGRMEYVSAVRATQGSVGTPELIVDLRHIAGKAPSATAGGRVVELPPVLLAFLAWCALRRIRNEPIQFTNDTTEDAAEFLRCYIRILGSSMHGEYEETEDALKNGIKASYFREKQSRLKKALVRALGSTDAARPYCLAYVGRRGTPSYQLALPGNQIRVL
jgi:CRISPR-associated protein (TIGR02584 family)